MLIMFSSLIPFGVSGVTGLEEFAEETMLLGEEPTRPRETSAFGKLFSFPESAGRGDTFYTVFAGIKMVDNLANF